MAAARAGRRRAWLQWCLRRAPAYIAASSGVALCVSAVAVWQHKRILGGGASEVLTLAAAAVLTGLLVTGVHGAIKLPSLLRVAATVDDVLGLNSAISNALQLSRQTGQDGGFSRLAILAGERAAGDVKLSRVYPLSFRAMPWCGAVLALCLLGVPALVAHRDTLQVLPRIEAQSAVNEAKLAVATAAGTKPGEPAAPNPAATELEEIERELESGRLAPAEAAARAASVLQNHAEQSETEARASQRAAESVREAMARAAGAAPPPKQAKDGSALQDAMSRGDLDRSADAVDKLADQAGTLTPAEREEASRQLAELAKALEDARKDERAASPEQTEPVANSQEPEPQQEHADLQTPPPGSRGQPPAATPEQQLKQELRDAAKKASDELAQPAPPKDQKTADASKPDARPRAESQSPSREPKQSPATDQQKNTSGEAQESKPTPDSQSRADSPESPKRDADTRASGKEGEQQTKPSQDPTSREGQKPSSTDQSRTGQKADQHNSEKAGEQPKATEKTSTQGQPDQSARPSQGENGRSSQSKPDQQSSRETSPRGTEKRPESAQGGQRTVDPDTQGEQGTSGSSSTSPGKSGPPSQHTQDSSGGLKQLAKKLREAGQQSRDAQDGERRADELRRQAQKTLARLDQNQRGPQNRADSSGSSGAGGDPSGEPSRQAAQAPQQPWTGADQVVDFRTKPPQGAELPRERAISEIERADGAEARQRSGGPSEIADQVRAASQSAERAIEQHSVSRQHQDLVRRVFRRYRERVEPPAASPASVPDAKPAGGS